jgi:hypothetical protein
MEGYALLITAIAGLLTALFAIVKYFLNYKKEQIARKQVRAAESMVEIKLVITELGLKLKAAKVLPLKVHDGGDLLDPSSTMYLTILDEYKDDKINTLITADRYKRKPFRLGFFAKDTYCRMPKEKVVWCYPTTTKSEQLKAIWEAQKIGSTAIIYLGMNKAGMHILHISYQLDNIDHFPPVDQMKVDWAVNELRNLYDLY